MTIREIAQSLLRHVALPATIVLSSIFLTLLAVEWGIRAFGDSDGDGRLAGYRLRPGSIDLVHVETSLQQYLATAESAKLVYDETLGWRYRAHAVLMDGNFTTQAVGMRAGQDYGQAVAPDTLRIAILGDSFAADVDVADEDSWGLQLERLLNEAGLRAEVLNFGVEAHGMGQAFLRWQHNARAYAPDIVIFGVQPENINRNVNVFRVLYRPRTGIPLAKPRFVLTASELSVVNQPVVPPEALSKIYRDLARHPLAAYEFYYDSRHLSSEWWSESRLLVFASDAWNQLTAKPEDYSRDSERVRLGIAILDAMASDVASANAHFLAVYLPRQSLLEQHHAGRQSPYHVFMQLVAERTHYIAMENALGRQYLADEFWGDTGHYGPQISRVVGAVVAKEILSCVENGSCDFTRRQGLLAAQR